MTNDDYNAFTTLKDSLYVVSEAGKLTTEARRLRDQLILELLQIKVKNNLIGSGKNDKSKQAVS